MDRKIIILFGIVILLNLNFISAALSPAGANFEIDFSQLNLSDGDWQLSIVNIPAYEINNVKAKEIFDIIKSSYLDVKDLCGIPNYIELKLNPSQEEIESYANKNVIIQHYFEGDLYYILDNEKYSVCQVPIGSGSYNSNFSSISQNKYKSITNFWIHHYSKAAELERGGEDIKAFYPPYCEIKNDLCTLHIIEDTEGPYFVVLEKMDSKDEVYFSELVNINWDASGEVNWTVPELNTLNTYNLKLKQFQIQDENKLLVEFEGADPVILAPEKNYLIYYIIGGFIILIIIFFILSKKRR